MADAQPRQSRHDGQSVCADNRKDWRALILLLLVVAGLRLFTLLRTEVAARDSIGYIRYALEFERGDANWGEMCRRHHQHPGYPLTVLAVSYPVRFFLGGITPYSMQLSAQLASGVAAILLVFPMFYLGKLLWERRLGFWAALIFQFLPVVSHILSDGVSEAVFLLWAVWGIYFGCRALQSGQPKDYALCGVFCGLAYLTRPEGALVLIATALVLSLLQLLPNRRGPLRQWLTCTAALSLPAFVIASPYYLATGHFTNKPTVNQILNTPAAVHRPGVAHSEPLFACIWAAFIKRSPANFWQKMAGALWELGTEIIAALHYFWALPALLGIWWRRGLIYRMPALWMLAILCFLYSAALLALAMKAGYISNRHVLVLVLCATYAVVVTLCDWRERLSRFLANRGWQGAQVRRRIFFVAQPRSIALLGSLAVIITCLPKTLQPLHANRAGHRAAGAWLAQHVHPGDLVQDDHCWAHYFAGQVFLEGTHVQPTSSSTCYTVISRGLDGDHRSADRRVEENKVAHSGAHVVYYWPERQPLDKAKVVIYSCPRQ